MVAFTHVLDTDTFTLFLHGVPKVVARVGAAPAGTVAVTVVTVEESLSGWQAALRRKGGDPDEVAATYARMAATVRALAAFPIADYSVAAMARCGALRALKLNVGSYDLRIASIALEIGAKVATRNLRDFGRVPGLIAEDWAA